MGTMTMEVMKCALLVFIHVKHVMQQVLVLLAAQELQGLWMADYVNVQLRNILIMEFHSFALAVNIHVILAPTSQNVIPVMPLVLELLMC